jgi:hypothetical protein
MPNRYSTRPCWRFASVSPWQKKKHPSAGVRHRDSSSLATRVQVESKIESKRGGRRSAEFEEPGLMIPALTERIVSITQGPRAPQSAETSTTRSVITRRCFLFPKGTTAGLSKPPFRSNQRRGAAFGPRSGRRGHMDRTTPWTCQLDRDQDFLTRPTPTTGSIKINLATWRARSTRKKSAFPRDRVDTFKERFLDSPGRG